MLGFCVEDLDEAEVVDVVRGSRLLVENDIVDCEAAPVVLLFILLLVCLTLLLLVFLVVLSEYVLEGAQG